MSNLTHKNDNGIMKVVNNGIKCQKCGYFVDKNDITKAYLKGKIDLPIQKGPAKMDMK
jgi:hypothetical protein